MTRLALALLLCAACYADPEAGDGIHLPTVEAAVVSSPGNSVVKVTRDGRVFFLGKRQSVNELIKTAREPSLPRPFKLRADRYAIWMHVQWVMAALGEAGHKSVLLAVEADGRQSVVRCTPLTRGLFEDRSYPFPPVTPEPPHAWGACFTVLDGPPVEYQFNYSETASKPAGVGKWAAAILAKANEEKNRGVFFALEAEGTVQYQAVIAALAQLQRPGVRRVDVALEALHPWDRDLRELPTPPRSDPLVGWWEVTDRSFKGLHPMNLPVALMAEQDKDNDPDDRLIIGLMATGRVRWRSNDVTLDELSVGLKRRVELYDIRMKRMGRTGYDENPDGARWSKLYVLLWADQDAPWQHGRWILAELARCRIYKIQFGARKFPSAGFTQAEAERLWAGREIFGPPRLHAKLACFQSTLPSGVDPRASYFDVHLRRKDAERADALVARIRDAYKLRGERMIGRIHAEPRTPFGRVVEAVNCFAKSGVEKVDLAGVELASDEIRKKKRLP